MLRSLTSLLIFGSVFGAASLAQALDPQKAITQYVHQAWGIEDGLPQNSVLSITQTKDGYLWLATQEGLARFDGVRFEVFDKINTKEIKHHSISVLYRDLQGNLWIGTWGGGLTCFKDGVFTSFTTKDGLTSDIVKSIHEDDEGSLWIGTLGGLNRLKDDVFDTLTAKDGLLNNDVFSLYEDREGSLWIGTLGGLNRFKDGVLISFTTKDRLTNDVIFAIHEDHEGNLWIGTEGRGLIRLTNGGLLSAFTTKDGLTTNTVRSIYEDHDRSLCSVPIAVGYIDSKMACSSPLPSKRV